MNMNLHVDFYETFWWSSTCNRKKRDLYRERDWPMPMGLVMHDQVKRQIFVAPSPHFSWTLTCLLHGNPSNNSINPLALLWLCTNSHSHSHSHLHYLGKEHFIALHCLTDWFVTDKSTNVDSFDNFDNFSHKPTTILEMFVQVPV